MVIYSAKSPDEKLNLDQISKWLTGRYNVFRPSVFAAPIPELAGRIHAQASPDGSAAGSQTGGIIIDPAKPGSPPGGTAKQAGPVAGTQNPGTIDRDIVDPEYVQRK
jgi:type IV pilus assembly protein PilO